MITTMIGAAIALAIGVALGWFFQRSKVQADTKLAGGIVEAARKESETILREARASAQEEAFKAREQFDQETKERRQELSEMEKRVMQRESNLDRRVDLLERKTEEVAKKETLAVERERELHKIQGEIDELKRLTQQELERVAGLSAVEAKQMLLSQLQEDVHAEAAAMTRRILEEAKQSAESEAKQAITIAVEPRPDSDELYGYASERRDEGSNYWTGRAQHSFL